MVKPHCSYFWIHITAMFLHVWILRFLRYKCDITRLNGHIMRNPVYAICKQQRRWSACIFAQSNQHLCCSLPVYYNTSTCYSWNFKTLASLISWAGRFETYLVTNLDNRFFSWRGSNVLSVRSLCLYILFMLSLIWFDFSFTALQHILGHFGHGQLT